VLGGGDSYKDDDADGQIEAGRRRRRRRRRAKRFAGARVIVLQPEHTQTGVRRRVVPVDRAVDVPGHRVRVPVRRRARDPLQGERPAAVRLLYTTARVFRVPVQVYNVIPSISAITGITPQTYVWRIAVAFHVGPRVVIAQVYYNYFVSRLPKSAAGTTTTTTTMILINLCYWLNLIEIAAICGVTYISNRENYRTYPGRLIIRRNTLRARGTVDRFSFTAPVNGSSPHYYYARLSPLSVRRGSLFFVSSPCVPLVTFYYTCRRNLAYTIASLA